MERRRYDSGDFHDGCRAETGIQITLLHSVPIYMPLCHLQAAQRGGGGRGAAAAVQGMERWREKWKWERKADTRT